MKQHVYFIPGMSASSAIFERINLPKENFETHYLEWLMPSNTKEPLDSYANRFCKLITEESPVLIGVSFGGVLAQELAKKINISQLIIISSIKHHTELSPFYQFLKKTKLYTLYPPTAINFLESLLFRFGSQKIKKTLTAYRKFLPIRNPLYTKWAIRSFINWKKTDNQPITHIHGNKDPILPVQYIHNAIVIKNGSHAMIVTKSKAVEQYLVRYLT